MSTGTAPDVLAGPLRGGGALVRDYLAGRDLSRFYRAHHAYDRAYTEKAAEVDGRLDATARAQVASAIRPLGDAGDRLSRILGGDGYFVTTGQQPALFGGPLYTLCKILTAIRLAEQLETDLGRPVLALFWVGSDDHDWDEANHTTVIDADGYAESITVRAPADEAPLPLSERTWGPGVGPAVDRMLELLPDGEWGRDIGRHVRAAYSPGATVAASSTATIVHLLADRRLAVVDAADPAVRRAAAPVLRRELERSAEHGKAVALQSDRLVEAGYRAQVAVDLDAANVMLLDEGGRDRLVRTRGGWRTRRGPHPISDADLLRRLEREPDRFSPNVLLRPVVESALFPTLAYVAGPGELSYFAQIGCLFRCHGMEPPVVVPRASVTLIEPNVRKALDALDLDPSAFAVPYVELLNRVLRSEMPEDVRRALDELDATLHAGYARLAERASGIDPTLHGPVTAARNAALGRLRGAEKKIVRQLGRRNDVLVERLRRASANLYPDGAPQERVLNVLPLVARYGPGLIDRIEQAIEVVTSGGPTWSGPGCD